MTIEKKAGKDALIGDLKAVMHDVEEILSTTVGQTGDKVSALRARAEENLRQMRRNLGEIENNVLNRARVATRAADHLVHENPWKSIAIASGTGLLLGILIGRR